VALPKAFVDPCNHVAGRANLEAFNALLDAISKQPGGATAQQKAEVKRLEAALSAGGE
jgi:hypothetical protein